MLQFLKQLLMTFITTLQVTVNISADGHLKAYIDGIKVFDVYLTSQIFDVWRFTFERNSNGSVRVSYKGRVIFENENVSTISLMYAKGQIFINGFKIK